MAEQTTSPVFTLEDLDSVLQVLVRTSVEAREKAYCPYSKFAVGAALLCEDGTVVTGCNVENISYGLTICAERTAVVKAVSEGKRNFAAIAICAEMKERFVGPCGACRQVLAEFNMDMVVYLSKPNFQIMKCTVGELLPHSFDPRWVTFDNSHQ